MDFVEIIDDNLIIDDKIKNMLINLLEKAAEYEKVDKTNIEFSVSFVNVEEIHEINKEYRGIDRPTDVISFALNDDVEGDIEIIGGEDTNYIGDIIICADIAAEQANDYGHSYERELAFLAVHGFLHLLGYDHMTDEDEKIMFTKQEEILNEFGLKR